MITPARDGWRCLTAESLINCWWERQMVQPFSNIVQQFLIKLTMQPAYDPAVALANVYPTKVQAYVHIRKVHSSFICTSPKLEAALTFFNRWVIKQTIHINTMGFCSQWEEPTVNTGRDLDESPEWKRSQPWRLDTV